MPRCGWPGESTKKVSRLPVQNMPYESVCIPKAICESCKTVRKQNRSYSTETVTCKYFYVTKNVINMTSGQIVFEIILKKCLDQGLYWSSQNRAESHSQYLIGKFKTLFTIWQQYFPAWKITPSSSHLLLYEKYCMHDI